MPADKEEARVLLKITEDGAEYETFEAALVYEDGRPVAVNPDPADRTPGSAQYDLDPEKLRRLSINAEGAQVFQYLWVAAFVLPALYSLANEATPSLGNGSASCACSLH
jgi:hypothetical protein